MAVLFVTSPTSGTASMQRILQTIAADWSVVRVGASASSIPTANGVFLDPQAHQTIYWFQGPRHWSENVSLAEYEVIAHFRDPRDMACNQFWWALQHPNDKDSPEVAAIKRKKVQDGGIDRYVVNRNNSASFNMLRGVSESSIGNRAVYTSYTQLCCAFDYMMENLCRLFKRSPSSVSRKLEVERPENLGGNERWAAVGGTWRGSDVSPGRFRRDLSAEAAQIVTKKYEKELLMMKTRDAPFLSHHYD